MSYWASVTIIVPASLVEAARNLGACIDPAGRGMYSTPLSATGKAPATHFVSSGSISAAFVPLLSDAAMMYGAAQHGAQAQGLTLTAILADCVALVAQSDVSDLGDESAEAAFARLGLMMINEVAQ